MAVIPFAGAELDLAQVYTNTTSVTPDWGVNLVIGNEYLFPNQDRSTSKPWLVRSPQFLVARLVQNNSGGNLTSPAKKIMRIDPADPSSVTGLTSATNDEGYPCSEWVNETIPDNALFWVITGGLCKVIFAATITANVTAGDYLNPSAATNGTVDIINTFTANKALFENIISARFRATASVTASGNGGTSTLVEVMRR